MPKNRSDSDETRQGYLGFITKRRQSQHIGRMKHAGPESLTRRDGLEWKSRNELLHNLSQHMAMSEDRH